ncbi:uncharacterized protein LOC134956635 [Pseudophryne corroboree]|uniref:uncharacterized protein LOC134956635 n=1 Tax=Pseudophryne corroboree TaxID=495146 RepID=UPI003081ECD9
MAVNLTADRMTCCKVRHWADFKSRVKIKSSAQWRFSRATGGGALPETVEFTDFEEQALVCVSYEEVVGVFKMDSNTPALACPHAMEAQEVQLTEAEELGSNDSSNVGPESPPPQPHTDTLPQPSLQELLSHMVRQGRNTTDFHDQMLLEVRELTSMIHELSSTMRQGMCDISSIAEGMRDMYWPRHADHGSPPWPEFQGGFNTCPIP